MRGSRIIAATNRPSGRNARPLLGDSRSVDSQVPEASVQSFDPWVSDSHSAPSCHRGPSPHRIPWAYRCPPAGIDSLIRLGRHTLVSVVTGTRPLTQRLLSVPM